MKKMVLLRTNKFMQIILEKIVQFFTNCALKYISKLIRIYFFAAFLLSLPLYSQESDNISVQSINYNTDDGLPNQLINCTFQDSQGFFWITTNYGFSRFDGKTFVNYSPEDLGISFGRINEIYEDKSGNLWLSEMIHESSLLKKRILIFNPNTEKIKLYHEEEARTYYSIGSTPEKDILLGTKEGELFLCTTNKQELVYAFDDKRPITQLEASPNYYWLNSGDKITLLKRNGEFVREWSASYQQKIIAKKEDGIYVRDIFRTATMNLEDRILLFKADKTSPEIASVNKLNEVLEINEDWEYIPSQEKFIVYNHNGGLSFLEETGTKSYLIDSLAGDGMSFSIEHIYHCSNGFFWISSASGVYKLQITTSKFESFLHKKAPLNFSMRSIVANGDSLYCNTYSGNIIYDLSSKKIIKRFSKNDIEIGLSSIQASDGCIYLAGTGVALQQICENTGQENFFYYDLNKLSASNTAPRDYWAILEDSKGKIWLGNNQGLSYLDTENQVIKPFENYKQFRELSETLVYDIVETEEAYWIASQDGLFKMEEGKGLTSWLHSGAPTPGSDFLPTNVIVDIHEDEEGYLWLTTFGSGLIQFNPKNYSYKQFTVREGLAHNVTNDILEDDFGNLWISTNNGITCFNRKTKKIINFDKSDGLHLDEFNKKSSIKLKDGRFVFGGLNGFVAFNPEELLEVDDKEVKSNLRITQMIIGDSIRKAIDTKQAINLKDTKVDITIDLHLLEFVRNEPASYEWKWKDESADFKKLPSFQLHLSEVPYGERTIVFRAKSAKGIPADNELEITFSAPTLFSLRQILVGIAILFGLYFFFFRENKSKGEVKITSKKLRKIVLEDKRKDIEVVDIEVQETEKEATQASKAQLVILSPTDKEWLDNITEIIQQNTNIGQFSVEDMAREVNLSSRQLSRKIKGLTGITPNQFLRDIKLEKAKALLESGTVTTVAETSQAVGFEKPDYFSRLFQEKYGIRPISYLDKKKKQ
jgi:ligand-binding sensor domain-containing protein/AraC-like DNA-binding protein